MTRDDVLVGELLRVGRIELPVSKAAEYVQEYTAPPADGRAKDLFAWQAYDRFAGGKPNELTDGELLTPILLNVRMSIDSFVGLKAIRPELERLLAAVPSDTHLAGVTDDEIDKVARLFGVLDKARPHGVRMTTLAKVLHRKRPKLIPLYDGFVEAAYLGSRIEPQRGRATSRYAAVLMHEMKADLQHPGWAGVVDAGVTPPELTPLPALDVVAWRVGRDEAIERRRRAKGSIGEGSSLTRGLLGRSAERATRAHEPALGLDPEESVEDRTSSRRAAQESLSGPVPPGV